MASSSFAFRALLKKVNPDSTRVDLASRLPGEVRDWLKDQDFETVSPHSRLIGSYARQTAITEIKDVDTLIFLPTDVVDRTPESVLRELKSVLDDYPDASVEASAQRRSIRLDFQLHDLCMDIVGAVAQGGLDSALSIPDRQKAKWIQSDPLGYGASLSVSNGTHGSNLIPLIKLVKAWRDEHMIYRRPKSYLLEVIVFHAVTDGSVTLVGQSTAQNVCDFFEHIQAKWETLMDKGDGVPRVLDPQLNTVLKWERSHFETFMRRVGEAARSARAAIDAEDDELADPHWQAVFPNLWPTADERQAEARHAAKIATPGTAFVSPTGRVASVAAVGAVQSRPTTFHGPEA